jgi:hypothetical protein
MTGTMLALSVLCLTAGVAPAALSPILDRIAGEWSHADNVTPIGALVPWPEVVWIGVASLAGSAVLFALLIRRSRRAAAGRADIGTWDCGYIQPSSPRLQYTTSSFGALLIGLFGWLAAPLVTSPESRGLFPQTRQFSTHPRERLLAGIFVPFFRNLAERCVRLRILQHGQVQVYLVYILFVFMLGIALASAGPWSF